MKIGLGEEENIIEIEKREPVKKDAKSLLNSASITSLSLVSLFTSWILGSLICANWNLQPF